MEYSHRGLTPSPQEMEIGLPFRASGKHSYQGWSGISACPTLAINCCWLPENRPPRPLFQ